MHPVLRRSALAAACASALLLAGCGGHVASTAPITWAPADTPYLLANTKPMPADVSAAWSEASDAALPMRIAQLGDFAKLVGKDDPMVATVLNAVEAELADVHSRKQLAQTVGLPLSPLYAIYGIGDVPVVRVELASPDAFNAFWARVEKRAGVTTPTATVDGQKYRVIGSANAEAHLLVATEHKQLVMTVAPAKASADTLKHLLGLDKPRSNAAGKLGSLDSKYGYGEHGSGYIEPPKFFANLFDSKQRATRQLVQALSPLLDHPACASEVPALVNQVPLVSGGLETATTKEMRSAVNVQLAPSLLGALTALKQPVAGMDEKSDPSMFDLVLALPVEKWQAFIKGRAEAVARKSYQCPALQALNRFAKTAANPPVQLPPEMASLQGLRVVLDKWDIGPQIAGRALVASSNPAALANEIQQTLPQFALKTIPTNGKPVSFDLPPKFAAMLGSGNLGWIAADQHALAVGVGAGEDSKVADALNASAGNGDTLLRLHLDGKVYPLMGSWMGRLTAFAPGINQARTQGMVTMFDALGRMVESGDITVKLDDKGVHMQSVTRHR